jgi:hypothetical protein
MCTMAPLRSLQCNAAPAAPATVVYSYAMMMRRCVACRHIKGLMRRAGLAVREDAMGNIFGRCAGSQPDAGAAHSRLTAQQRNRDCSRV